MKKKGMVFKALGMFEKALEVDGLPKWAYVARRIASPGAAATPRVATATFGAAPAGLGPEAARDRLVPQTLRAWKIAEPRRDREAHSLFSQRTSAALRRNALAAFTVAKAFGKIGPPSCACRSTR